jgi:hypothetical protein
MKTSLKYEAHPKECAVFFTFAISLVAYLTCAAGYIDTIDADPSFELARSIVERGSLLLHPSQPDLLLFADSTVKPGTYASKMGVGTALLYVPWILLAKSVAYLSPAPFEVVARFFISLTNSFVTAGIVSLLMFFFIERGFTRTRAATLALIVGFTTLLFPYSKTCQREPLQALLLLGTFVCLDRRNFLGAAACIGLGLNVKSMWLVPAFPAFVLAAYLAKQERKLWMLLIPAGFFGAGLPLYQWICFGNPFETGYNLANVGFRGTMWNHPFWQGMWVQIADPRSGFLIFNLPTLFCFALLAHRAYKKNLHALDVAVTASFVLQAAFYACWYTPLGGAALGPRYLVATLPILFLVIRSPAELEIWHRKPVLTSTLVALLFAFQLVQTSIKPQQYWELRTLAGHSLQPHWLMNFEFFRHKLQTQDEIYEVSAPDGSIRKFDMNKARSLRGLNFWWRHAAGYRATSLDSQIEKAAGT